MSANLYPSKIKLNIFATKYLYISGVGLEQIQKKMRQYLSNYQEAGLVFKYYISELRRRLRGLTPH